MRGAVGILENFFAGEFVVGERAWPGYFGGLILLILQYFWYSGWESLTLLEFVESFALWLSLFRHFKWNLLEMEIQDYFRGISKVYSLWHWIVEETSFVREHHFKMILEFIEDIFSPLDLSQKRNRIFSVIFSG